MMASQSDAVAQPAKDDGKDIRQLLTTEERTELTLLVANITEIMVKQIHDTFDASVTSTPQSHQILQPGDKNPNKATSAPHEETDEEETARKLLERREKELSAPEMIELKNEAVKFFENWRESLISRLGEAVNNSKEVVEEQKENASAEKTPDTAPQPETQVISK
jgi:ribosome biogenesis GTPase A